MIIVLQVARSLWRQLRAVRREDDEGRDAAFDPIAEARAALPNAPKNPKTVLDARSHKP